MTAFVTLISLSPAFAEPFGIPIDDTSAEPAPPERKQDILVFVDCHDLAVRNTSSKDTLKVELFDSAGLAESKRVDLQKVFANALDPATCALTSLDGSADDWGQMPLLSTWVTRWDTAIRLRLTATGSDAFWVDRLRMRLGAKLTDRTATGVDFGVDGKKGWCLSTKSSDSFGADRQDGKCKTCVEFRADGSTGTCS